MPKTFFIADLHLSENAPHLLKLFRNFMKQLAPQAKTLYILGDLFDFWVGDDEQSPLIDEVKLLIKQLVEQGVPCYFCGGNRDFLLGKGFAKECGLQLLPDYQVLDLYGIPTLVCHGDTLCTDDIRYQRFRKIVHQPWLQRLFQSLPLRYRVKLATKIRQKTVKDKSNKSAVIMDINQKSMLKICQQYQVTQLIHGHTHRPALHRDVLTPEGVVIKRLVVGDWGEKLSLGIASQEGLRLINLGLDELKIV